MQRIPRTMAVVGGGVIGCEYATMFRALGVEMTLVGGQDRLLPFLDREIADRLRLQIELLGVKVRLDAYLEQVRLDGPEVALRLRSGEQLTAECVLFTTERVGATDGLALERAGLATAARGRLPVNEHYQTAVPHIYAAGDIIGFPALASTSMEQARVAYAVGRALYRDNSRGQITGDLSEKHFGGTIDYFIQSVFNHPTLAEAYKYAAYDGLGNLARAPAKD